MKISDTAVDIIGVSVRSDQKCMAKFQELMNQLYNLDIKGY